MTNNQITQSIQIARLNWVSWTKVFEFRGHPLDNPLIDECELFVKFLNEYGVGRTIRAGRHDEFRRKLARSKQFEAVLNDNTGQLLDEFEKKLRLRFGTFDGRNRLTSVLSKVAAFVRPEQFVAWDGSAKKGLNIIQNRGPYSGFKTYAEYLQEFNTVYYGGAEQRIRDCLVRIGSKRASETEPRFCRRVLDVSLMICGTRDFSQKPLRLASHASCTTLSARRSTGKSK